MRRRYESDSAHQTARYDSIARFSRPLLVLLIVIVIVIVIVFVLVLTIVSTISPANRVDRSEARL